MNRFGKLSSTIASEGIAIAPPAVVIESGTWLEVAYCSPSPMGDGYGTGSARMYGRDLAEWLRDRLLSGKPVLITGVRAI